MNNKLIAGSVVFAVLTFGFVAHNVASGQSSGSNVALEENSIVEESYSAPVVETTTTTIDLSFLNTTTTTAYVAPKPKVSAVAPNFDPGDGSLWDQLAICESGGNWAYPPVSGGFSGGLMFHIGTWRSMGGEEFAPDAYLATREQQIIVAERTRDAAGGSMRPWPGCSRKYGWL